MDEFDSPCHHVIFKKSSRIIGVEFKMLNDFSLALETEAMKSLSGQNLNKSAIRGVELVSIGIQQ